MQTENLTESKKKNPKEYVAEALLHARYDKEARQGLKEDYGRQEEALKEKGQKKKDALRTSKKQLPPYSDNPDDDVFIKPPLPYNDAHNLIPIKKIRDGVVLTNDGRYVRLMDVGCVNMQYKSYLEQTRIADSFYEFLKVCPDNVHIKMTATAMDMSKYISNMENHMHLEENRNCRYLMQDQIEYVSQLATAEAIQRRFTVSLEHQPRRLSADHAKEMSSEIYELEAIYQDCSNKLQNCGNEIYEHENETEWITETYYKLLNRKSHRMHSFGERLEETHNHYLDEYGPNSVTMIPITDYMAPRSVEFYHDHAVIDGLYYAWLYVKQDKYPLGSLPVGWTSLLINLGEDIDVDIYLQREDIEDSRRRLQSKMKFKRVNLDSMSQHSDNYDEELKKLGAGNYLQYGVREGQNIWYAAIMLTVIAGTKEDVDWRIARIKQFARGKEMDLQQVKLDVEKAFLSTLPCGKLDKSFMNKSSQNVLTNDLAGWYPFSSYEFSSDKGNFIGIAEANHTPMIADFFDTSTFTNANTAILGSSGAGKTYLLCSLATGFRMQNIQTILLIPDKAHEYKRLCDALGGNFISVGPQSDLNINVFEIRKYDDTVNEIIDGGMIQKSKLMEKMEFLHLWLSLRIKNVSELELEAWDHACLSAYADYGITKDNDSLIDLENPDHYKRMPIFSDVQKYLLQEEDGLRVAKILNRECAGSAKSYNQLTNVDLTNKLIVFDVSSLKQSDLLPSTAYTIIDLIFEMAKQDRTTPTVTIMDELWRMIGMTANPKVATQILEIFKIIRGYAGAAIYATQDISDHDSAIGKGILAVCKTKILLPIDKDDEEEALKKLLSLSKNEYDYIIGGRKGNALFCVGKNNIKVQIKVSPLMHSLITTDRRDLEEMYHEKKMRMEE